jgi:D-alanyl-D-alanine carboxypeptidase
MTRLFLPIFFALSTLQAAQAQAVPHKLDSIFSRTLRNMRNAFGLKSLSAAIQLSNDSVWTGAYGLSSTFPLDSVSPSHAYAIGSITKTITAACILQLADEGKLNLDDNLQKWLPPVQYINPNITIRQLLSHQSGLYDVITNPAYDPATKVKLDSVWTLSNLVKDYINPPLFAPGTGWSYSNTNYALLGMIIEAATGNTYRAEFARRFFAPLHLNTLALPPFDPNPSQIAHLWIYNNASGTSTDAHAFYYNWDSFRSSAGSVGGYYSTARDIAVWNRAFLRGDLHSPKIMEEAKKTVATTMPANGRYGLGIMERKFLNMIAYGHGGDIGYSSVSYYFPQKDISITVLNNDSKQNSWALAPVIQALLKNCLDYEASVSADNPLDNSPLKITAYPNPFVSSVFLAVELPSDVRSAQIVISDAEGKEIATAKVGPLSAGTQVVPIHQLEKLSTGLYFAQLVLDGKKTQSIKVVK